MLGVDIKRKRWADTPVRRLDTNRIPPPCPVAPHLPKQIVRLLSSCVGVWLTTFLPATVLVGLTMRDAHSLSVERTIVLFADQGSSPLSAELGFDGSVYVTLKRARPTLVKLDKTGKVTWTFEGVREEGIDKNFQGSVPLRDGSVVICASRRPLPGLPSKHYPGSLIKLDVNGKEIARYDPIDLPEDKWPIWSALMCARWGEDILFVADAPRNKIPPKYLVKGKELGPNLAIRVRPDLSIVWTRPVPVYSPGGILGARPRSRELSGGALLLSGGNRAVVISDSGDVLHADTFNDCLMLTASSADAPPQLICRASPYGSPWQLSKVDQELHPTEMIALQSPATDYSFATACSLPGGFVALGGSDQHQQGDVLVFDAKGKRVGSVHFPTSANLIRSQIGCWKWCL